jgi:hypothetical protein
MPPSRQQIKDTVSIAVLTEKLQTFMQSEEARHTQISESLAHLEQKMDNYFKVEISKDGAIHEYDLKSLVMDHDKKIQEEVGKWSQFDKSRIFFAFVEAHPKLAAVLVIFISLGVYYAGSTNLLKTILTWIGRL